MTLSGSQTTALVMVSIAACLGCLWMVFFFGRRLQVSGQLREYLLESVARREYDTLYKDLLEQAMRNGIEEAKDPPPQFFGKTEQLWNPEFAGVRYSEKLGPNLIQPVDPSKEQALKEQLQQCQEWEKRERERFEIRRKELEQTAKRQADERVPKTLDISLLGGGWAFLLEFSTVIVIIFTLLVLGIVKSLDGKEIATILAAIAGYVLGKASSGAARSEKPEGGMGSGQMR